MRRLILFLFLIPAICFGQNRADRDRTNPVVTDCAGYGFRGHWEPAAETYCAEALALFARMTTPPTTTRKDEINTLIVGLKTAGIWSKMDAMYVLAAADEQAALLNWIADTNNATTVNSPSFVADSGFKSDGSSSWVNSHYNPYEDSVNFSRVSANVSVYCVTSVAESDKLDVAGIEFNGTYSFIAIDAYDASGWINGSICRNSQWGGYGVVTSALGLASMSRNASDIYVYKDGVYKNTEAYAPTFMPNVNMGIGCLNYNWLGSPTQAGYSNRRISFVSFSSLLSASEQTAFANAIETYMDAVGCGTP